MTQTTAETTGQAPATPADVPGGAFHPLRVTAVERLTDDSVAVSLAVPEELRATYTARPGQHLTVRAVLDGQEVRRTYSLCGEPGATELTVGIKAIPEGVFTRYATTDLRPGDTLDVAAPGGSFGLDVDPSRARHVAGVVAGSGITPVLGIARAVLAAEPDSRVTLVYGNRTARDVMFLEELYDLRDRHGARFRLLNVLSREEQESPLLSGRIDRDRLLALARTLLDVDDVDDWFLCGPLEMVTAVRDTLTGELGVERSHVHVELFHAEPVARRERPSSAPGTSEVEVLLAGRRSVVSVAGDDETVLDAVLRVRADAPYACRGGVCGTCRARVVEGDVEMDANYALEPDELERGLRLMCQSRPTTATLRVEFV
ncbi:1,2-phenylacetyl-CoA epoxidase subunit PaaE [Aquipuribacter nitratireducens]|uniref:1,2-phenylacetyl-CoA epoxidase subunit PaaE n=1 Tax=Aquipuribacter nitratireducens TaxID=650104 RepID=A0ABW0GX09_9MICO